MIETLLGSLFSTFVIGPIQAEMNTSLLSGQAPAEVVSQIKICLETAPSALVARATSDPVWAVTSMVSVWAEIAKPDAILQQVTPGCQQALKAAQPYLNLKTLGS